jgi:hypothetical protein
VVPFVVQLVGEYVVEILESIRHHLSDLTSKRSTQRLAYGDLIARNPGFFARTEHRVVSYWACYHRGKFPDLGTYPGGHLLELLRAAAIDRTGTPLQVAAGAALAGAVGGCVTGAVTGLIAGPVGAGGGCLAGAAIGGYGGLATGAVDYTGGELTS